MMKQIGTSMLHGNKKSSDVSMQLNEARLVRNILGSLEKASIVVDPHKIRYQRNNHD